MTNNDVFKKLRVALMLRDDEILDILKLVDFKMSKSELGALFRKEDHPNYRECGDQILRNFLNGLVIHLRGSKENPKYPGDVLTKRPVKAAGSANTKGEKASFKTSSKSNLTSDSSLSSNSNTSSTSNSPSKMSRKSPRKKFKPDITPVKYKNKGSSRSGPSKKG